MATKLDALDRKLLDLLAANARLPVVQLAKALGCARSTVQLRLKALEDSGQIAGYTISRPSVAPGPRVRAMVLMGIDSRHEVDIVKTLSRRYEIHKLYTVSGRYDLCAMLTAETTEELDRVIDRIRQIKGIVDTVSTVLLSCKLDRPE